MAYHFNIFETINVFYSHPKYINIFLTLLPWRTGSEKNANAKTQSLNCYHMSASFMVDVANMHDRSF